MEFYLNDYNCVSIFTYTLVLCYEVSFFVYIKPLLDVNVIPD